MDTCRSLIEAKSDSIQLYGESKTVASLPVETSKESRMLTRDNSFTSDYIERISGIFSRFYGYVYDETKEPLSDQILRSG
jgi:hypothetical protein